MKIESKEDARKRGVPSPDRAEAFMLAICKRLQMMEYYPVHDQRLRFGLSEDPYDRDYPLCSRFTRWDGWAKGSLARQLRKGGN